MKPFWSKRPLEELPPNWYFFRLKDVAPFVNRGITPDYAPEPTDLRVFNQKCVRPDRTVNVALGRYNKPLVGEEGDRALLRAGDIVVNSTGRGTLGRAARFPGAEGAVMADAEITIVRGDPQRIIPAYLAYLLGTETFYRYANEVLAVGATNQTHLNPDALRGLPLVLPEVAEQRRVVAALDVECRRIDVLMKEVNEHAGLVRAREISSVALLLGQGTRGAKQRMSTLPWLAAMPADWPVVRLKHKARLESGHTPSRSREELWTNCVHPWISLNDVGRMTRSEFLSDTVNKISDAGLAASSARILPAGTVVLSRDATIGRSSIMSKPMATSQHFAAWVCGPELEPRFLWLLLTTLMQPYLDSLTDGATLKTIGMGDLRDFRVPLPPMEEQRELVDRAAVIRAAALTMTTELAQQMELLKERRESLVTRALGFSNNGREEAA